MPVGSSLVMLESHILDGGCSLHEGRPAVRVITDWKKLARISSAGGRTPSVARLVHSTTVMKTVPVTSSTAEPLITSLWSCSSESVYGSDGPVRRSRGTPGHR